MTPGDGIASMNVRLANDVAELPRLTRSVHEFCEGHGLSSGIALSFTLALEEAITNVIDHGYDDAARREIQVRMSVADRVVTAEVIDDGRVFDPRGAAPPQIAAGIEDRPIGGLGIFLVKHLMDDVHYRRVGGRNCLTLSKRVP